MMCSKVSGATTRSMALRATTRSSVVLARAKSSWAMSSLLAARLRSMLKYDWIDEATSNLDLPTAEHFARTVNQLKGKVTMLFITHQLPRGLQVDEIVALGQHEKQMSVVKGEKNQDG